MSTNDFSWVLQCLSLHQKQMKIRFVSKEGTVSSGILKVIFRRNLDMHASHDPFFLFYSGWLLR